MAQTPNTQKILREHTIYGNEITDTARITKMNMILAGDGHSNIEKRDSLAHPVEGKYDVVLANMPYSQRTKYGDLYDISSANGDSICVQHCMKAINSASENGRMAIIVPEGFLFRKDLARTREYLLERCQLQSIISLPQGVFLPYTGVKTDIIYATKVNHKIRSSDKRKDFWYFDVKNDGYTLDNHRRKMDVPSDLTKYEEYRKMDRDQWEDMLEAGFEIIPLDKVCENSFILAGNRYRTVKMDSRYETVPFSSIATLIRGVNYQKNSQTTYRTDKIVLPADNITLQGELSVVKEIYLDEATEISGEKRLKKDDIFICMSSGSKEHIGKVAYVSQDTNYYAGGFMGIIRVNPQKCIAKYLYFYLLMSERFREEIKRLTQGANINNISSTINSIMIPVPSVERQQEIVEELSGYHSIVCHAKGLISSYKPVLPYIKEYETISLGNNDWFTIQSGGTPDSKNAEYWNGDINWITLADLPPEEYITEIKGSIRKITQEGLSHSSAKLLPAGTVVVSSRATIGRIGIARVPLATNQGFKNIIIKQPDKVLPEFLALSLREKTEEIEQMASGATFKEISKSNFEKIEVKVPPVEEQKRIVDTIEKEQKMIQPLHLMIESFSAKIKQKITELWSD